MNIYGSAIKKDICYFFDLHEVKNVHQTQVCLKFEVTLYQFVCMYAHISA